MTGRDLFRHQRMKHKMVNYEEEEMDVTMKEAHHNPLPNSDEEFSQSDQHGDSFTSDSSSKPHVNHLRNMRPGVNFECDQCGKRFPSKTQLNVHLAIHEGKRVLKCNYCNATFLWESLFIVHKRIHTGDRPFKCDLCGKGFTKLSKVYVHKREKHRYYDIFTCGPCGCKFETHKQLIAHRGLCSSLAPNRCKESSFDRSSSMSKCKDLSAEKTFTCKDCKTVVKLGSTTLSNVFTVANISNVKCFINNHTLI